MVAVPDGRAGRAGADGESGDGKPGVPLHHLRHAGGSAGGGRGGRRDLRSGSGSVRDENGAGARAGREGAHPSPDVDDNTSSVNTNSNDHSHNHRGRDPRGYPEYDRGEWKHWTDEDGDCQDARQEVLIAESLEQVTFETNRRCRVEMGRWWAPYLEHHLGNPGHIDVDHHVPLKNAHLSGGWRWDAEMKERYANYLGEENHLVAISARHNRSKGARGPEEWAPPDNALWCEYALGWTEIKHRWGLTMTPYESDIVMDMLHTCEHPPRYEVGPHGLPGVRDRGG